MEGLVWHSATIRSACGEISSPKLRLPRFLVAGTVFSTFMVTFVLIYLATHILISHPKKHHKHAASHKKHKKFDLQDLQFSSSGIPSLQSSAFSGKFAMQLLLISIVYNCDWFWSKKTISRHITEGTHSDTELQDRYLSWMKNSRKILNPRVPNQLLNPILRLAQVTVQGILSQLAGTMLIPADQNQETILLLFYNMKCIVCWNTLDSVHKW